MKAFNLWSIATASALLTTALMTGCGTTQSGASTSPTGKSNSPVTLDLMINYSPFPSSSDQDILKQELDKALGTNLKVASYATGDDLQNQLNVRMAAGNPPDLFQLNRVSMKEYADKGLLLDLTPYIDSKLGPTKKFIGDDNLVKGSIGKKVYAIARNAALQHNTFWIRKDWLDHLALKEPSTLDELLNVSKQFTLNDPDGNGKKDTFGITGTGLGLAVFGPAFGGFGVGMPGDFYLKDGKLTNSFYDPKMKDALAYIKTIMDAGVVDPEIFANSGVTSQQKAFQGQAGIIYTNWTQIGKDDFVKQYKAVNPNANWIQLPALKGPYGQFNGSSDTGAAPSMYAIPQTLKKNPDKLQKIFDFLNYISVGDGLTLVQYGVKGRDYNLDGVKMVPTDLMAKEGNYFAAYQFTGRPEKEYLLNKFPNQEKEWEFEDSQPYMKALNGFITIPTGYNATDANRYINEELIKFVTGKRPLSEYDDFIKTLEQTYNYKNYVNDAQKQLTDMGLVK